MGKISDALKKVTEVREEKRQIHETQIIEEVKTKEKEEENIIADRASSRKDIGLLNRLKEKLSSLNPDLFYLAKGTDGSGVDPRVVPYSDSFSHISEQYRALRTSIRSCLFKENQATSLSAATSLTAPKIFTISSALPGEGKTLTAVNVAVSLAEELESKILLVDCDLRNGSVHKFFNLDAAPGIADALTYGLDYRAALRPTQLKNLFLMPRGKTPSNPSEILNSNGMRSLMGKLKTGEFTYIIIDTPPLLPFTDAGVLSAQTHGAMLVVKAHQTQAGVIKRAKELLDQSRSRFLGFILTQTDYSVRDFYGYHYYRYSNSFRQ